MVVKELQEYLNKFPEDAKIYVRDMYNHGSGEPPYEYNVHFGQQSPGQHDDEFEIGVLLEFNW